MDPIGGVGRGSGLWGPAAGASARGGGGPQNLREVEPRRALTLGASAPASPAASFGETLQQVLAEVNGLQLRADDLAGRLARGEVEELHQVVIAQQEAAIALRLIQELRDKLILAYQELMRMQV